MSLGVLLGVALGGCGSQDPVPAGSEGAAGSAGPAGAAGVDGTGGVSGPGGVTGSGTGGMEGTPPAGNPGPYQPLVVNAMWAYQVNDRGIAYEETNVVEALEDMGGTKAGIMAYRVRENLPTETQLTWYQSTDTLVMRHHEQALDLAGVLKSESWFTPFRLRVDETTDHTAGGATWTATFTENHTSRTKPPLQTSKTETWNILAAEETVTVPAGTFKALRVSRTDQSDGSIKTFWFARGVGKVKEITETGHTEELSRYSIPQ